MDSMSKTNTRKKLTFFGRKKVKTLNLKCPGCGEEIESFSWNCPYCLYTINKMENMSNPYYCTNCRFTNNNDTDFCINCGQPLTKNAIATLELEEILSKLEDITIEERDELIKFFNKENE